MPSILPDPSDSHHDDASSSSTCRSRWGGGGQSPTNSLYTRLGLGTMMLLVEDIEQSCQQFVADPKNSVTMRTRISHIILFSENVIAVRTSMCQPMRHDTWQAATATWYTCLGQTSRALSTTHILVLLT